MRYKLHGRSGLRVSELCLGAMTFGADWGWGGNDSASREMFDAFAEAGGNFIDTAYVYTEGASERLVGEFVAADRDHFVIATKYTPSTGTDISKSGNSRKNMRHCVETSLKRMKTDYIDLYLLHFWDNTTPIEEIMRGLDDLVRAGKVLYVAVSDTPAWQISRANMMADLQGWSPFIGMQVEYSLVERTAERELFPMAKTLDMGMTAWSPLAQGVLSGKFLGNGTTEATRQQAAHIPPRHNEIAQLVVDIAREYGCSPSQVALAAIRQLSKWGDIIPIIAGRNAAQVKDNIGCIDVKLDESQLKRLDDATAIDLGFPHNMLKQGYVRDMGFGRGNFDLLDNHHR
ncbi:MAG TPA: aldo/keto reductase [Alphaproteobacteria bacterium]|nr:aldo/keto reductase [Alphaproteobacteria bacterium]